MGVKIEYNSATKELEVQEALGDASKRETLLNMCNLVTKKR